MLQDTNPRAKCPFSPLLANFASRVSPSLLIHLSISISSPISAPMAIESIITSIFTSPFESIAPSVRAGAASSAPSIPIKMTHIAIALIIASLKRFGTPRFMNVPIIPQISTTKKLIIVPKNGIIILYLTSYQMGQIRQLRLSRKCRNAASGQYRAK